MSNELFPNGVVDLDLSAIKRKAIRFDKDDNRVVYLNLSDMNIMSRISEVYPKLQDLQKRAGAIMDGIELPDNESDEEFVDKSISGMSEMSTRLKAIDEEMRGYVDTIFDAPVSEAAVPDGSMYDPINGTLRFEFIIELLLGQYEANFKKEFNKLSKHTAKYTKGK